MINDEFFRSNAQKIWGAYVKACPTDVVVDEWADYRKTLTEYIIDKSAEKAPFLTKTKSLAIYGAGNCYDIDLSMLSKYFSEITLIDRDGQSLEGAKSRYEIAEGCTVKTEICNVGIIPDQTFEDFAYTALKNFGLAKTAEEAEAAGQKTAEFVETAYQSVQSAFKGTFVYGVERINAASKLGSFDVAVAAGLHSQINNVFTAVYGYVANALLKTGYPFKKQLEDTSRTIGEMQAQCTILTVVDLDDTIFKHLNDNGKFIYAIEKSSSAAKDSVVAGAYEATLDFDKRTSEKEIVKKDEITTEWPLSKERNIVYQMSVGCITKQ